MAVNEWVYDKNYSSWYYFDGNGFYITDKGKNQWQVVSLRGGELDKTNGLALTMLLLMAL